MRRFASSWGMTFAKLGLKKRSRYAASDCQRRSGGYFRRLHTEALEDRRMLSLSPLVPNDHFDNIAKIDWLGQQVEVYKDQWLVSFENNAAAAQTRDVSLGGLESASSLQMLRTTSSVGLLEAPDASVEEVLAWAKELPGVKYVEPNFVMRIAAIPPSDEIFNMEPGLDGLWGLHNEGQEQLEWDGSEQQFVEANLFGKPGADISAFEAWESTTGSRDVVVGVIDTGIDYTHPDLYLNIWLNQGEIPASLMSQLEDVDDDSQITFVDLNASENSELVDNYNDNDYIDAGDLLIDPNWENENDDDGNGYEDDLVGWNFINDTNDPLDDHFHGTHVAGTIGAIGDNEVGVAGVNWEVLMVAMKFLGSDGSGSLEAGEEAIEYATALRANEGVNLIATNNSWGGGGFAQSMKDSIDDAGDEGVLFVAAAGNAFIPDNDLYPHYPSSYASDNLIAVAATDAYDELANFSHYGLTSVDLGAPGVNTLSTFPTTMTSAMSNRGFTTLYETISGTSMATPHVTGVVALLAQMSPERSASEIIDAILLSVDPLDSLAGKTVTGGRLNAAAAIPALQTLPIVVSTLTDENDADHSQGDLSLREALGLAAIIPVANTIVFDPALFASGPATLTLAYDGPDSGTFKDSVVIDDDVSIVGPGANLLTIDGAGVSGIFIVESGAEVTLSGLTITGGGNGSADGTAIQSEADLLTLDAVLIEGNSGYGSGGVYQSGGAIDIKNSTIAGNLGQNYSGGVYLSSTTATIVNSTISGNTSYSNGGGVNAQYSQVGITNSTIASNSANNYGGGVYTYGGSVTLKNTIVAGNGWDVYGTFSWYSVNNVIGVIDGSTYLNDSSTQYGTASSPLDARLTSLGNYGGTTPTHALLDDSPAVDLGSNTAASGLTADQRGFARIVDGPDAGTTATVDVGAFELAAPLVVSTLDDDVDGLQGPGQLSLREAIVLADTLAGADTIVFDASLFAAGPATLELAYDGPDSGTAKDSLLIDSDVTIVGPGANLLTIDGAGVSGIFIVESGAEATVSGLTITGGGSGSADGTAIHSEADLLTLDAVLIEGNSGYGSGGVYQSGGAIDIKNSTIAGNLGQNYSGGVYLSSTTATIVNSTISGNTSYSNGGGVNAQYSQVGITNSTIASNSANNYGGGVYTYGGSVTLKNTIVAGNGWDVYGTFSWYSVNNVIGVIDGSTYLNDSSTQYGTASSPLDARLTSLGNYGGTTPTHALLDDSPAVDLGSNTAASGLTADQRGFARIVDGPDAGTTATVDVGAFEWSDPFFNVDTLSGGSDSNYAPGQLSLREALELAAAIPGADEIVFDASLFSSGPATIELVNTGLTISSDVAIEGPGADLLTIKRTGGFANAIVINSGLDVSLSGMTITGAMNRSSANAGGISSSADSLTITGVVISENLSFNTGGLYQNGGVLTIKDSTIANNLGGFVTGGIYLIDTDATIVNSTISGNRTNAGDGGGIHAHSGTLQIINSTITKNNSGSGDGGGIYNDDASVTIHNTIIAGNISTGGAVDDVFGAFDSDSSYNLIGAIDNSTGLSDSTTQSGTISSPLDARLAVLGDYGGPTPTHALLLESPAIDAGDDDIAENADLTSDQRGFDRFVGTVDIGAVEASVIQVDTLVDEDDSNYGIGDLSLREALEIAAGTSDDDIIVFAASLFASGPATIELGSSLVIDSDVSISGPAANLLTIDGDGETVFAVNSGVTATIHGLTVSGGGGEATAGIYSEGSLTLEQSVVSGNSGYYAGGIQQYGGSLEIRQSTISNNFGSNGTGGVLVRYGSAKIVNSTISGNDGFHTGGLHFYYSDADIISSTISDNDAYSVVGGIYSHSSSDVILHNTIVANNGGGSDDDVSGDFNSASYYNLIGVIDGSTNLNGATTQYGTASNPLDPDLAVLGNYGGPTPTHALLAGSPAIDAGGTAFAQADGLSSDQRGFKRFVGQVDIGSFEYAAPIIVSNELDEEDGRYGPGQLSLREALTLAAVLAGKNEIEFSSQVMSTLLLDSELEIDSEVDIHGPGADMLELNADDQSRVFVVNSGASATIRGLTMSEGSSDYGGAIYSAGNLTLEEVQISDSFASIAGGGIYQAGGSLDVIRSTINDNAGYQGGGIYIDAGTFEMHSSTVSGNDSYSHGGGIGVLGDPTGMSIFITHSTIAFNSSVSGSGGGIAIVEDQQYIAMHHTIVADNTASNDDNISGDVHYGGTYNLIGYDGRGGLDTYSSTNIILGASQTAGLAALNYYGGTTKTHALLDGSQAIDAGNPSAEAGQGGIPLHDQRGSDRVADGDDDLDEIIDIGAFELAADEYFGSL
ncbi:MAG: choice-of-anchor Q domain-containing protein [Pirellulales bacterium]